LNRCAGRGNEKAKEIYKSIPDFGRFLVKAYSEGSQALKIRTLHADGAKLLSKALAPYGGIVMWRSFVYDLSIDSDVPMAILSLCR
jgi:alpha-glucuronidase